jgi:hypothetical protein
MPQIVTIRSKGQAREDVISLVLSQDAVSAGPGGDPWCGVTLNAEQARWLAQRLCDMAAEIENGEQPGYRTSPLLFGNVSSVVAVHDGSQQSHRAFQAAMQCARRSTGTLNLIGIVGIDTRQDEPTATVGDCEWQRGWLSRLADMYSEQACTSGVTFNVRFLHANDPCVLLDTLYRMDFDLIVIPKALTQFGLHGERLMPSIVSRRNANVLVCP